MILVKNACGTSKTRVEHFKHIYTSAYHSTFDQFNSNVRLWLPIASSTHSSLPGEFNYKALYSIVVENDVQTARHCYYLAELAMLRSYFQYAESARTVMTSPLTGGFMAPLSNAIHLRPILTGFQIKPPKDRNKFLAYLQTRLQQCALAMDLENLEKVLSDFDAIIEKQHPDFILRSRFYHALCAGSTAKVECALGDLLDPKVVKRTNFHHKQIGIGEFLGLPAMWLAKLAWINGHNIEIDHPLVVAELLDEQPLQNFDNPYGFLVDPVLNDKDFQFYGGAESEEEVQKHNQAIYRGLVPEHIVEKEANFEIDYHKPFFDHLK